MTPAQRAETLARALWPEVVSLHVEAVSLSTGETVILIRGFPRSTCVEVTRRYDADTAWAEAATVLTRDAVERRRILDAALAATGGAP